MCLKYRLFHLCARYLCIAGGFILLFIVVVMRVLSPSEKVAGHRGRALPLSLPPEPIKVSAFPEHKSVPLSTPAVFDVEAFKRTIIDNNLFRPLGWRPPVPIEPYRLIGTKLAIDATTPPQAIIESTAGEKTYIVSLGETLDASTEVVDIQPKWVTLSTNGQQRTLRLNTGVYLNASPATRSPRRATHTPNRATPRPAPVRSRATPAPTAVSAPLPDRRPPLSDWETREGQPIPIGDARLKNPEKWRLQRR